MIFTLNSTAFASFIQKLQNKECAHHLIKSGGGGWFGLITRWSLLNKQTLILIYRLMVNRFYLKFSTKTPISSIYEKKKSLLCLSHWDYSKHGDPFCTLGAVGKPPMSKVPPSWFCIVLIYDVKVIKYQINLCLKIH